MPNEIKPPTICQKCGNRMRELKGVSQRTGKPYHFWACESGERDHTWNPPSPIDTRHSEIIGLLKEILIRVGNIEENISEIEDEKFKPHNKNQTPEY